MKTLYKIYVGGNVEGKHCFGYLALVDHIKAALYRSHIDNATVLPAEGLYQGKAEPSAVIEIIETPSVAVTRLQVLDVARQLRATLRQEAILVTAQELTEIVVVSAKAGGSI